MENTSLSSAADAVFGGALGMELCSVAALRLLIRGNVATFGGGIGSVKSAITVAHTELKENKASVDGGAAYFRASSMCSINSASVVANAAFKGLGGGLCVSEPLAHCSVNSSVFRDNRYEVAEHAFLVLPYQLPFFTFLFLRYRAVSAHGGGMALSYDSSDAAEDGGLLVFNSSFSSNSASYGGGGVLYALRARRLPSLALATVDLSNEAAYGDVMATDGRQLRLEDTLAAFTFPVRSGIDLPPGPGIPTFIVRDALGEVVVSDNNTVVRISEVQGFALDTEYYCRNRPYGRVSVSGKSLIRAE
ncbi:unnamed protein product, partial [Symbiodinium sp. KB8]